MRKILVTTALPYANGPIHLGHLIDNIQADIWVRFQKMRGHDCVYICGSDSHGTPIMILAEKLNMDPNVLVEQMRQQQQKDFLDFLFDIDNFYTTHSPENKALAEEIFTQHQKSGHINKRMIQQAYDAEKKMFLPDRFIKGECPKCSAKDQYGDSCEVCGATYSPTELKNAYSTLTGSKPIEKESEHYLFQLNDFENYLKEWTRAGHLQPQIVNKLDEWFKDGLREWDISRDAPYFGFLIPGETEKYFYVWLDAPIGYMASFKNFCATNPKYNFDAYWKKDSDIELYHFIGKDIVYFHTLFWPALLHGANFRTPNAIFVHGFVTIEGQKMSKSRGTFIKARTYLNHLQPEYLRYYFAAKLNSRMEDIDFNYEDFLKRVNADLVGKYVNIASRSASFLQKYFAGKLSERFPQNELYNAFVDAADEIATKIESLEYNAAIRQIMALADRANQLIDEKKPWTMIKDLKLQNEVQDICTLAINLFRVLTIYLKPILPTTAKQIEEFLNVKPLMWDDLKTPLLNHTLREFKPLMKRIEQQEIDAMKSEAQENATPNATPQETFKPEISLEDFAKVDLRIAKILHAEQVEGADKLLRLEVEIGNNKRQVFAGIKSAYAPEALIGKYTVVVANLAPRKMRFGTSEGMVLAASGPEKNGLWLLSPDAGAESGMIVK